MLVDRPQYRALMKRRREGVETKRDLTSAAAGDGETLNEVVTSRRAQSGRPELDRPPQARESGGAFHAARVPRGSRAPTLPEAAPCGPTRKPERIRPTGGRGGNVSAVAVAVGVAVGGRGFSLCSGRYNV